MVTEQKQTLTSKTIYIPSVYAPIVQSDYRYFLLSSGRISGKTSILVALWWMMRNKYPDRDIIVLQSTSQEIKDSLVVEIEKFLIASGFDVGTLPTNEYQIPKSKEFIQIRGQKGTTKFFAITDSMGGQRTRGISTQNPISLVLYEEAQKNRDRNVVEQSVVTFIRQLDKDARLVVVGNNETIGHWFVDYAEEKRRDPEWCCIYANCYDIWELLNEQTQRYIENTKKSNPIEFRRMFLGDINASTSSVVFPQFSRQVHYLRDYQMKIQRVRYLFVGIDHATANDVFAIVPVAVLEDGTAEVLEVCYDDPKETQVSLAPTEQCGILEDFMAFLDRKYNFSGNNVPICISIDGAAATFRQQVVMLKNTAENRALWRRIEVHGFTMKKKDVNLGIIKSAFALQVLKIMNEGQYDWTGKENKHRLVREIEGLRYRNGRLDPNCPNDFCDALEYGLIPYYSNCYHLSFPTGRDDVSHYRDITTTAYRKKIS